MRINQAVAAWFLRNARIKHGHPPLETPIDAEPVPQRRDAPDYYGYAKAGVVAAAAGALGWIAAERNSGSPVPPAPAPVTQPATQPQPWPDATPADRSGSLYQYLEDNRWHLPE